MQTIEKTSCEPTSDKSDQDSAWKDLLEKYFPKMMEFFYPEIYQKIDWSKRFKSLDQELQQVVRQAIVGKRFVDKLFQVFACDQEAMVLIHPEIQGQSKVDFEERLFEYGCLLYARYKQPVLTLVLLIDPSPNWRPIEYRLSVLGLPVHHFQFYPVKLLDYRGKESELKTSDNPFAWITLAQLASIKTRNRMRQRLTAKIALTRLLYERDWTKTKILNLYAFIDWVMVLPKELKSIYNDDLRQFEEEKKVNFITSMEQAGIDKGIQIGLEQGLEQEKKEVAKRMFAEGLGLDLIQKITGLSQEELDHLLTEH